MKYFKIIILPGLLATTLLAKEKVSSKKRDVIKTGQKIMAAVKPSVVQVQYYLRFDKGQGPSIIGYKCGNCNGVHNRNAAQYVKEDRPVEVPGYLIAPDKVITADILVNPRFIQDIKVKYNKSMRNATISSYFISQNGVELKLDKPLDGATPFVFDNKAKSPFYNVSYSTDRGFWTLSFSQFFKNKIIYMYENNTTYCYAKANSVIVDKTGKAVGFSTNPEISLDNSWKTPPAKWAQYSAPEMKRLLSTIQTAVEQGIFQVRLGFRSPKADKARRYSSRNRNKVGTEVNTIGLLYDKQHLLVLANLDSPATARLEKIAVYSMSGQRLKAKFDATLKDYGMLVAKFAKPLSYKGIIMSQKQVLDKVGDLLPAAEIKIAGERLTAYYGHSRIVSFYIGWKGMKLPGLSKRSQNTFLFNEKAELVAFPVIRRQKTSSGRSNPQLTQSAYLVKVLASLKNNIDPSNIPVVEAEENRLAWLGIESQPLNSALAKAHNISEQTNNGKNGVMISYVYAGSPAAKAGLKAGDFVLRLYVEGEPSPVHIRTYANRRGPFPWPQLDRIPEVYFDRIPTPWPSIENQVNKLLTNLGFGKKFTLRCYINGKAVSKHFSVEQAPEHYENANKGYSKYLGLTVRNITFELRRYFQMKKGTPGIIISKIKPGSKASVSGLKPYEIITRINGKAVTNVKQFNKLINGHKSLRLSVKRMFESRIVKIKMNQRR
jgi:serine protease Do